jgi:serine/threonine-protein kinase
MGIVYKARDLRLDRTVALKFLPQPLVLSEADRARFLLEAKAAANLNHPNVCTVHGIEESAGSMFIVMEYVDGDSLRTMIEDSSLDVQAVLNVAIQIAEALDEAHSKGIVHRDIKSENILVSAKHHVKVMDFGLAKLKGSIRLTKESSRLGTLANMAPEQLRGETVDQRADLWSFGVVLYEMLAGKLPFHEETEEATLFAILRKDPITLTAARPDLPHDLERVVSKLLGKKREERYQTAGEVLHDLKSLRDGESLRAEHRFFGTQRLSRLAIIGGVVASLLLVGVYMKSKFIHPTITSLAVLPLENLSGNHDEEYFADGMTEALITNLAKLKGLRVVSRTSVMQYKGVRRSLPEIARALHVDAVLEGSVIRSSDRVRITAQLIEAHSDRHLWAQSNDRDLRDLLILQKDVATAIADEIHLAISPEEHSLLSTSRPVNPAAYRALLKGRFYVEKYTEEGLRKGLEYLTEAVALDPEAPQPYAALAQYYVVAAEWTLSPHEAMPRVKQYAQQALSRDESISEAHTYLGVYQLWYGWDWGDAEREFKRAIALKPNSADAYQMYAYLLALSGRHSEALAANQRALTLDPLSLSINSYLGWMYYMARRYDEAAGQLRRALDLDPNFWFAHLLLGRVFARQGLMAEAMQEFSKARHLDDSFPESASELGAACALAGNRAGADSMLTLLESYAKKRYVAAYFRARIYAALGEKDKALDWLERGVGDRSFFLTWMNVDPEMDVLRPEPRFHSLLEKMTMD